MATLSEERADMYDQIVGLKADNERLRTENQALRSVLLDTLTEHAEDPDHPCEACGWTMEEWPAKTGEERGF